MTPPPSAAWSLLLACLLTACSGPDDEDPNTTNNTTGIADSCEGGLAEVDGECVVLENALDVLIFRTTTEPYASTCAQRIVSDDPGVEQAVIAEAGACRVIDTSLYGQPNFEPAGLEPGVTLDDGTETVKIDEAQLFESCIERRTVPAGFFRYDTEFTARFDGNATIPSFASTIRVPADPGFSRGPIAVNGPIVFSWREVEADSALVVVAQFPVQIVCTVDPAAGQFEVPSTLVAMLPESDPPGLEPVTSIRMRNRVVLPYPEDDAVVTLTAEAYQSLF